METRFAPITLGKTEFSRRVRDFTLTEATYAPGTHLARHAHEQPAVSLVLEGTHAQDYGARGCCERGAFEAMIEPSTVPHRNHFPAGCRLFILAVETGHFRTFGNVAHAFADARIVSGGRLRDAVLRLHGESRATDAAAPLLIEGLAFELVALAAREQFRVVERVAPRWLRSAREELHAEYRRGVALSRVASRAGVHPVYFSRAFRKFYGCSPGEYARRLQVEFAARLLRESDAPACLVALDAGFSDQSHFTRVFKRHTGETPMRYRQAARSQPRR